MLNILSGELLPPRHHETYLLIPIVRLSCLINRHYAEVFSYCLKLFTEFWCMYQERPQSVGGPDLVTCSSLNASD
jgi:hypothetical protein